MPRLFVALDPPPPVAAALVGLATDLHGARWIPAGRIHLTLFFIGEAAGERVPAVESALAAVSGPAPPVVVEGLGAFPNRRAARVLVVAVEPHPALEALHLRITGALAGLGIEAERRPFRPHLTLARLKDADRRGVRAFLEQPAPRLAFVAEAFHLYASTLSQDGPQYQRLRSFPLRARTGNSGEPGAFPA